MYQQGEGARRERRKRVRAKARTHINGRIRSTLHGRQTEDNERGEKMSKTDEDDEGVPTGDTYEQGQQKKE